MNRHVGIALALALITPACGGESHDPTDAGAVVCVGPDAGACPSGTVCDARRATCVECVFADDCAAGSTCIASRCVPATSCSSSRMCPGLVCDTAVGTCVECVSSADCSGGLVCERNSCVPRPPACTSDRDCSALGLVCDLTIPACVECVRDTDCAATEICGTDHACTPRCTCTTDADCSNGVFCDGDETCAGCTSGCVPASSGPCLATQTCDEPTYACLTMCPTTRDADGDGADAIDCGGTDCDDSDASVHVGATEACNRRDDDCSAGGGVDSSEDADADGFASPTALCTGGPLPATDCNDAEASIAPGAPETCNAVDDDCNMITDDEPAASASCTAGTCIAGSCSTGPTLVALSPGSGFSCALISDGSVECWGRNDTAQLGRGSSSASPLAIAPVAGLAAADTIGCDDSISCALSGGTLSCWASVWGSAATPVSGGTMAVSLHVGEGHACIVREDATAACIGRNNDGELGTGSTSTSTVMTPVAVMGLSGVREIAEGSTHSCALLETGHVMCWGAGVHGQLGNGSFAASLTPVEVVGIDDAIDLALGPDHGCVVRGTGDVACWGGNFFGSLGDGTTTPRSSPVTVAGLTGVTSLAEHFTTTATCAIVTGGRVRCWGRNVQGELGDGTGTDSMSPVEVVGLLGVSQLRGAGDHYCAVAAGRGWCWGANYGQQLGDGTTVDRLAPINPMGLP